jgi:hypothetical protein
LVPTIPKSTNDRAGDMGILPPDGIFDTYRTFSAGQHDNRGFLSLAAIGKPQIERRWNVFEGKLLETICVL